MTQEELNQLEVVQNAANRGVTAEIEGDEVVLFDGAGYTLPTQSIRVPVSEVKQTLQNALNKPYWPH